ncbi:DUF421 domain-containing protein [Sphingomonas sp.]|uniref:DUF421 domain-containing protein n=1 Tax=Sphingomonas sp. TaxID=28214 RepID=UPI0035C80C2E
MFALSPLTDAVVRGAALTIAGLLWILLLVRIVGLRSFSKMTAFDFVITLATASLLATAATVTGWAAYVQAMVAILALLATQVALALLRRWRAARRVMENTPVLLMHEGAFIDAALRSTRVSRSDVMAKLRAANVHDLAQVRAVVLETTGDISVLHGGPVAAALLDDVEGAKLALE